MTARLAALALLAVPLAAAQPAVPLADALQALAQSRSVRLVYAADLVAGRTTACPAAVRSSGRPVPVVLACVLDGTGLEGRRLPSGSVALYRAAAPPARPRARPGRSAPPTGADRPARSVTLSGFVTDAATGEALIGAAVYASDLGRGVSTNAYGFYSLPLPPGPVRVAVSYVGYATQTRPLALTADLRLDVALDGAPELGEVVVEADETPADRRPESTPQMGQAALTGTDIRGVPALLGEADVLKAIQLLPGVRGGTEGTAGLYVRGGSPDQTLLLLDGTPVYNANHLFGFVSTFNGDAVQRAELTKGAYPARFGGRLGSVLDVRLRDGSTETFGAQGQVGLLSSRLLVEGPIAPGRASFLVSGRRTYADLVAKPILAVYNRDAAKSGDPRIDPTAYFYDLNAKLNWQVSDRDRAYLSLYRGTDQFGAVVVDERPEDFDRTDIGLGWGNVTSSLRYTRVLSPRAFGALTVSASDYAFDVDVDIEERVGGDDPVAARARYRSGVRDLAVRADLDWAAGRGHAVRLGGGAAVHRFTPGALSLTGAGAPDTAPLDTLLGARRTVGADVTAYAEDEWAVSDRLTLALGVHGTVYAVGNAVYPSLEPRVSASYRPRDRLALKASVATTQQPVHLLTTGAGIGLPADLWVPATDRIGPERGWQAAVGAAGSLPSGRTSWTAEAYWREMRGLVAYREGAEFTSAFDDWQDLVVTGDGRSVGAELFVQHRTPRLTAWLGYTLAKTDRQFDAIDGGARFPFRYDRTHDLSAVALYQLSRAFDVSASVSYGTGNAVTLAQALYEQPDYSSQDVRRWSRAFDLNGFSGLDTGTAYGARNGFRLPAYARLDLAATWYFRRGPRPHALSLNVYNATNHKNPFLTRLGLDRSVPGSPRRRLTGVTLFPVLPTLSYQFSF